MATDVTDSNFQAEVIESDQATIVDFWAPWCGPCRAVSPVLEEIDGERSDVRVVKLNTDDNPQVTGRYGITGIPTLNVYVGGEVVKTLVGAYPKQKLVRELEDFLN